MRFKYPRNGVVKIPFYKDTWVAFENDQMIGRWGGKPNSEKIHETEHSPHIIPEDERLRYLSCLTIAGHESWKFSDDYLKKPPLQFILEEDGSLFYYTVFAINGLSEEMLHREDGPAVLRKNGTSEVWIKGEWKKTFDKNGNLIKESTTKVSSEGSLDIEMREITQNEKLVKIGLEPLPSIASYWAANRHGFITIYKTNDSGDYDVVARTNVKYTPGWIYYIDEDGDLAGCESAKWELTVDAFLAQEMAEAKLQEVLKKIELAQTIEQSLKPEPLNFGRTLFASLAAVAGLSLIENKMKNRKTKALTSVSQKVEQRVYEYEKFK